jgi:mRNA interferase RelE/StbE
MTDPGLRLTPQAHALYTHLSPTAKRYIKRALREIVSDPFVGKALQAELSGYRSYRIQRYRVVYRFNEAENRVEVIHFGHRSHVYEKLRAMVNQSILRPE